MSRVNPVGVDGWPAARGRGVHKRAALVGVLCWFLISLPGPAGADTFVYVRYGEMNVDGKERDDIQNLAFNLGYELDSYRADMSLAAEISRTLEEGKTGQGRDLEFETEGLFLIYRSTRSLFASLRVGLVRATRIRDGDSDSSSGLGVGGGIGIVIGQTRLQIELTSYAAEANFLTLGLQF